MRNAGGGIVASGNPSATLRACAIEANAGSGLACDFSSPHVENSTIAGNRAAFGGAIDSRNADPVLFRCHLSGNTADAGGGVCTHDTSGKPLLEIIAERTGGHFSIGMETMGEYP